MGRRKIKVRDGAGLPSISVLSSGDSSAAQRAKPEPAQQAKPEPVQQAKPKPAQQAKPKPAQQAKPKPAQQAKTASDVTERERVSYYLAPLKRHEPLFEQALKKNIVSENIMKGCRKRALDRFEQDPFVQPPIEESELAEASMRLRGAVIVQSSVVDALHKASDPLEISPRLSAVKSVIQSLFWEELDRLFAEISSAGD